MTALGTAVAAAVLAAACSSGQPVDAAPARGADVRPSAKLDAVKGPLCVTKGRAAIGGRIGDPTVRAVVRGSSGDAASLTFKYLGDSDTTRELASGQARRQLGLKLRAEDGCNLVYVMWRLDPRPALEVSVKRNPGMTTHRQCGAAGYTKVRGETALAVPALEKGGTHTLRAEITDHRLAAWIDDRLVWRGDLPGGARELRGVAGLRSDNVAYELVAFDTHGASGERCVIEPDESD
ncbi:MAG: hypothetical protein KF773_23745 [Deltaproteobacteria bacterium]|nr:hypothetical protein [Deltaproteobacteria bacterium]